MTHYFAVLAAVVVPALLATAVLGIFGHGEWHLRIGLMSAIGAIGLHTLLILFMIVTGRVLKEAVRSRDLSRTFLDELNEFFARKQAYPAALFAAVSITAAGVLGYGAPALGLPQAVHWLVGLLALVVNFWAVPIELRALADNQHLLDRAASELDRIDQELTARGEELEEPAPLDAGMLARGAFIVAVSVWMPYLYWALVVWRGDFGKASIHPWIEISGLAWLVWLLAKRESGRTDVT